MTRLLSRYAESVFWMARYVERAENLARHLDVQETFSRDSQGDHDWQQVLNLYADDERFTKKHGEATPEKVLNYYLLDRENLSSVYCCLRAARENARTLRPLISTEMWVQLNTFFYWLSQLDASAITEQRLSKFCQTAKEACQAHTGITEGTFYRDEAWYFYQLGRQVERADQTTRLVDVKYHLLLPADTDVGSPLDVSQWNALLRAASGFHAFRRVHASGMSPAKVAGFLLFNPRFPRSVVACVDLVERTLTDLRHIYGLRGGTEAMEHLDQLRAELAGQSIESVLATGLHEYLDWIQRVLLAFGGALSFDFFGAERPGSGQSQSQLKSGNPAEVDA